MHPTYAQTLRLGTRGSRLAIAQSRQIAAALMRAHAKLQVELVICKTTGDRVTDRPLQDIGGKGLFVKEIEEALLAKAVDFAVHSLKDLPVTEPLVDESELIIAAVPVREEVRDVLCSSSANSLMSLRRDAKVGTGSLRRRCQLIALRPDLRVLPLRGNVDTRLEKLSAGEYDGVILAAAGLYRCGLFDADRDHVLEANVMLPAAAQGALALQCRRDDSETIDLLSVLNDETAHRCTDLERAVVAELGGDCHSPIAALAEIEGHRVKLRTCVGRRNGELPIVSAEAIADWIDPFAALHSVIAQLKSKGASALLE